MFHRFFSNINDKVTWRDDLHLDIMLQFGARQQSNIFVFVSFFCVLYFVCIFNFIQIYHNMLLQWFIYKKKVFFFISLLNLYFFLSHYFPLISEIISTYLFAFLYFIEYWINSLNWVLNWIWMGGYGRYSFHMYTITVCNQ